MRCGRTAPASPVLVVQDFSYGMAFGELTLKLDRRSGRVLAKSARVLPAWADAGVGPASRSRPWRSSPRMPWMPWARGWRGWWRTAAIALTRSMSAAGESVLGDLVADAQRAAVQADIALMNPGGLRADLRGRPDHLGRCPHPASLRQSHPEGAR